MDLRTGYALTDIGTARGREFVDVAQWGFSFTVPDGHEDEFAAMIPTHRGRGVEIVDAHRGTVGTLAGVHSSHEFTTRVPGGNAVPTAGLTFVAVHPGHRRRGLLRAMIADHFARSIQRGEVLSTLYAAETEIYQRFGYGLAGMSAKVDLGRAPGLRPYPGAEELPFLIEDASGASHAAVVRAVQARMTRPGTVVSPGDYLLLDMFLDIPLWRDGAEKKRIAWVADDDGPAAYALFARKGKLDMDGPEGDVSVQHWGAATPAALQRLFSVISNIDLMTKCTVYKVPLDSPLVHMMKDPRALKPQLGDDLWVRILDVPVALASRGYAQDIDIRIEVTDALVPENAYTWRLVAKAGEASAQVDRAERDAPPEVRLDIQELSAAYLGGVSLSALAHAGLVEERRPGAVGELSRAMLADEMASCNLSF